jgi:hypothetical protein
VRWVAQAWCSPTTPSGGFVSSMGEIVARTRCSTHSHWRRSSASGSGGNCVEVAFVEGGDVLVRDSKAPQERVLSFTPAEWDAFLAGVRAGEFDR